MRELMIEMRMISRYADGKQRFYACQREDDSENKELKELKKMFDVVRERYQIYFRMANEYEKLYGVLPKEAEDRAFDIMDRK